MTKTEKNGSKLQHECQNVALATVKSISFIA